MSTSWNPLNWFRSSESVAPALPSSHDSSDGSAAVVPKPSSLVPSSSVPLASAQPDRSDLDVGLQLSESEPHNAVRSVGEQVLGVRASGVATEPYCFKLTYHFRGQDGLPASYTRWVTPKPDDQQKIIEHMKHLRARYPDLGESVDLQEVIDASDPDIMGIRQILETNENKPGASPIQWAVPIVGGRGNKNGPDSLRSPQSDRWQAINDWSPDEITDHFSDRFQKLPEQERSYRLYKVWMLNRFKMASAHKIDAMKKTHNRPVSPEEREALSLALADLDRWPSEHLSSCQLFPMRYSLLLGEEASKISELQGQIKEIEKVIEAEKGPLKEGVDGMILRRRDSAVSSDEKAIAEDTALLSVVDRKEYIARCRALGMPIKNDPLELPLLKLMRRFVEDEQCVEAFFKDPLIVEKMRNWTEPMRAEYRAFVAEFIDQARQFYAPLPGNSCARFDSAIAAAISSHPDEYTTLLAEIPAP